MAEVALTLREQIQRLRDLRPLLRRLGAILVARSQRAWREKRYGRHRWPVRYPNQPEPFINKAAALSDLNRGIFVRKQRFERTPVLTGLAGGGGMLATVTFGIEGSDTVWAGWKQGPAAEYAGYHQLGEKSRQPVKQIARKKLAEQIGKTTGRAKRVALRKMTAVVEKNVLITRVHARPALGADPPDLRQRIIEEAVAYMEGTAS